MIKLTTKLGNLQNLTWNPALVNTGRKLHPDRLREDSGSPSHFALRTDTWCSHWLSEHAPKNKNNHCINRWTSLKSFFIFSNKVKLQNPERSFFPSLHYFNGNKITFSRQQWNLWCLCTCKSVHECGERPVEHLEEGVSAGILLGPTQHRVLQDVRDPCAVHGSRSELDTKEMKRNSSAWSLTE